ncbi:MAG: isopenicillin N synthase family oxygenase [Cohaesibacter sp.]|nr:isopenicillin N synthase family oxygenase [Cohaesibacter sp.]
MTSSHPQTDLPIGMATLTLRDRNASRLIAQAENSVNAKPFSKVPILDISPLSSDDKAAKQELAKQIRSACIEVGFFYIKGHCVDSNLRKAAFEAAKLFFSQSEQLKRSVSVEKSPILRGYAGLLEENTDPDNQGDLHEHFDMALDLDETDPDFSAGIYGYGPNQWPDLEPFKEPVMAYHGAMVVLSESLYRGFALSLGLDEDHFLPWITKPIAEMRLAHYPPQTALPQTALPQTALHDPERIMGIGAHSDYDVFTILATDDVPALEVQNSADQWIAAPPIDNAFIVNVGDLLQRWTNDIYRSTFHRVVNRTSKERYSIPFFASTNAQLEIGVLDKCISSERPARYAPISASDYVGTLMREAYGIEQGP